MKQQQITIGNKTILVVDLPKEGKTVVDMDNRIIHHNGERLDYLPQGNWQLLGFISELTDLQLWSIFGNEIIPASISEQKSYYENLRKRFTYELQSNGIMTVNPYPEATCSKLSDCTCDGMYINECRDSFLKWQTAQSQLWVNPVLLVKN